MSFFIFGMANNVLTVIPLSLLFGMPAMPSVGVAEVERISLSPPPSSLLLVAF